MCPVLVPVPRVGMSGCVFGFVCVLPASWPVLVVVMSLRLMLLADAQTWTGDSSLSLGPLLGLHDCTTARPLVRELMQYSHYLAYFVLAANCLHYFALFNIIWF